MSIKLICILISFLASLANQLEGLIKIKLNEEKTTIYLFDTTGRTREDIVTYCSNLNGSMATIPNATINALIIPILTSYTWFDAKETSQGSRIYQTSAGEILQYFNWHQKEPNEQCSGGCCLDIDDEGKWHDYSCNEAVHTLCQIPVRINTFEYILRKIPEQNFSPESFTTLVEMNIPEQVKRIQSNLSTQESKSNTLQSNIDHLNVSMYQNLETNSLLLGSKIDSFNTSLLKSQIFLNAKINESIKQIEDRLHLLSNSSDIKFTDHDKKHERLNDSMEYLQEEIKREKEERKTIQITFLVLIILNILSLVSIVCYLTCQKRHKSRSLSTNVYSDSLLLQSTNGYVNSIPDSISVLSS